MKNDESIEILRQECKKRMGDMSEEFTRKINNLEMSVFKLETPHKFNVGDKVMATSGIFCPLLREAGEVVGYVAVPQQYHNHYDCDPIWDWLVYVRPPGYASLETVRESYLILEPVPET